MLGLLGGWVSDRLGPKLTMIVSLLFTGVTTMLLARIIHGYSNKKAIGTVELCNLRG
jgi:MFS family permease